VTSKAIGSFTRSTASAIFGQIVRSFTA
jgi:hypothetical protein